MDDDALRIRSNSGTYELPSAHVEPGVLKGVEREFVVSADRVSFSVEEPSATNRVKCRLVSEEFIGSVVTVHCESADGHDFKLQLQERDLTQYELKSGSRVWLSWNTEDAHVPPTQQE